MRRNRRNNLATFIKAIAAIAAIIAMLIFVSVVDGGAQSGVYQQTMKATVEVVVTLENGHSYTVSVKDTDVTVYTYGSDDPRNWKIHNW